MSNWASRAYKRLAAVVAGAKVAVAVYGAVGAGLVWLYRWQYALKHPWRIGSIAVVVLGGALAIWRKIPQGILYRWRIQTWSGMARAFPIGRADGGGAKYPAQKAAAQEALVSVADTSSVLQLLLVSGHQLIGSLRAPGYILECLRARVARNDRPQMVQVLLVAEECVAERAQLANMPADSYREGIAAVLWSLRELAIVHGVPVDVRRYKDPPIWQMVMSSKEIWFSCAHGGPTDSSTLYCVRRDVEDGLHVGLAAVWERRWIAAEKVDLPNVQEPDWNKVQNVLKADTPAA